MKGKSKEQKIIEESIGETGLLSMKRNSWKFGGAPTTNWGTKQKKKKRYSAKNTNTKLKRNWRIL